MKNTLLALSIAFSAMANASDMATIEKARTLCAGCHGPSGISVNPLWPNLAHQNAEYLAKSLHDYKSGRRNDPSMTAIGATLTDPEIESLAKHYAALPRQ